MDREAWCTIVHGGYKELDMTERLSTPLALFVVMLPMAHWTPGYMVLGDRSHHHGYPDY